MLLAVTRVCYRRVGKVNLRRPLGIPFDVRAKDSVSLRRRHRFSTGGESTWTPRSGPISSGPPTADGASCWRPPTGWCSATARRRR
ncbi:hypothetical protein SGPA1_20671 [Streptomyces misionensis JCM 4497]